MPVSTSPLQKAPYLDYQAWRIRYDCRSMITRLLILCLLTGMLVFSQDTKYPPQGQQLPGPPKKSDTAKWLKDVQQWRDEARVRAGLTGEQYERKELEWAQR